MLIRCLVFGCCHTILNPMLWREHDVIYEWPQKHPYLFYDDVTVVAVFTHICMWKVFSKGSSINDVTALGGKGVKDSVTKVLKL